VNREQHAVVERTSEKFSATQRRTLASRTLSENRRRIVAPKNLNQHMNEKHLKNSLFRVR